LDGARLFNAMVKLGVDERTVVAGYDSVSLCLSKGLGAPAGTMLLGSAAFIARALRWRKALGGGLRQAGVIAAAGLYALQHHVARLADDHAHAALLADGLSGLGLSVEDPQTNMVYVDIPPASVQDLQRHLAARGILALIGERTRLVTHLDVPRTAVHATVRAFGEFLAR
jgi:threonine aldolase